MVWPDASWLRVDWSKPFEGTGLLVLLTWIFAIFLQSVNREIFRAIEGYWFWGLTSTFNRSQLGRFLKLKRKVDALYDKPGDLTDKEQQELNALSFEKAKNYPSKATLILPTSFGNIVRAYEDYPRVVYGFESIGGWNRLQGLMSKDFREILGNDRARVDLWLNLCVVAFLLMWEVAIVARIKEPSIIGIVPLLLLFIRLAYVRSRSSAQQFGEQIKSAFDIYLPELAGKLGYVLSCDTEKNRSFWQAFGEVMVYHDPKALEDMTKAGLETLPRPSHEKAPENGDEGSDEV